ncbi:M1 family metallopeptidase [Candidatus Saccharibacteria bacterium]|nr:M1 family metallopeptidase [Candidatus Saccharibacteria bacterium]
MERFYDYFRPEKYVLDLNINKNKKTISGTVTVTGEVLNETIKFHAVALNTEKVLINEKEYKFKNNGESLIVSKAPLGEAEITIHYNGTLNENMEGAYLSTYEHNGETETIVTTQFESHYARQAFPCIDEPAAKAVFELIITIPSDSDDIILANTPVAKKEDTDSGFITTAFEPTPRMSTYLLAWVIGKFHGKTITNSHGVKITTYCTLNQDINSVDFANEIAARSLEFYDDNFKEPYPLKKLDQVAIPDFEAGAMENWGLVTYREARLLATKDATLGAKKDIALTVTHELSHQWFGDLVTMQWWDDLWLNESFASVMEYYAVDHIHPEYKIFEEFFIGDCHVALLRDAHEGVQSVHQEVHSPAEITTLFDAAIVYAKGARLMLMLIRLMGWKNFTKGLTDYFKKYKYQNTVGDDLWNSLKPYADFDPKKLMHAFIDKPGYPVVTNEGDDFKKYSQKRFLLDGKMIKSDWPLPEIREDMSGHYILNLSEDEFNARLEKFDKLGLEEKLRLLIDRNLVTQAGIQSPASLVPLALEFKDENYASVWDEVSVLIGSLRVYTDSESTEENILRQITYELIDKKLTEIGLTTNQKDDENTIRLRATLLALDHFAHDEKRLQKLADLYEDDYTKMDKEIRKSILCAKSYLDSAITDEFLNKFQTINDPDIKFDYLTAATIVHDEKQLAKVLKLLGDAKAVKPQDQVFLFVYLCRNPKAKAKAFDWMTKNWDFVKETGGEKSMSYYPMYFAKVARTEEEYKKYTNFFDPMRNDPAMARVIYIGKNEIKARIERINKYQTAVSEAIKKHGAPDRG